MGIMLLVDGGHQVEPDFAARIARHATTTDRLQSRRHRRPLRQQQFVAGRALLRGLLAQAGYANSDQALLNHDQNGRLRLLDPGGHLDSYSLSLAHSGELIVVALTTWGEVGIDIERMVAKDNIAEIGAFAFGPHAPHLSADPLRDFYALWTSHECVAKMLGLGMPLPAADSFGLPGPSMVERPWQLRVGGRELVVGHQFADDYCIAVGIAPRAEVMLAPQEVEAATRCLCKMVTQSSSPTNSDFQR